MSRPGLLIAAVGMTVAALPVESAGLQHVALSQVRQIDLGTPAVRAYLDLEDSQGQPVENLPAASLSATLGQWHAEVLAVEPFDPAERGIAYVFLVDISKSLSEVLFARMLAAIEAWIEDLGPLDRAAVLAFGASTRLVADFTADRESLLSALRSLGPIDDETLLHQALADALELCRRLDPDLPGRRAVVVFSDGKDEGSGLEAEDVLATLRSDPVPIYAIGYSGLRDRAERRAFLDLLDRFATNSGGVFFEATETGFAEAYEAIRERIRRVWVADFGCQACRPDGSVQRLQVTVTWDSQVLSDGGPVRLLPIVAAPSTAVAPTTASQTVEETPAADTEAEPVAGSAEDAGRVGGLGAWGWLAAVALAVGAFLVGRSFSGRRRSTHEEPATATYEDLLDPSEDAGPIDPDLPPPMPRPVFAEPSQDAEPKPPSPPHTAGKPRQRPALKRVRLVIVRGSRPGRQYALTLEERGVVGKRSDCDCVLTEESGIDSLQFELIQESGDLFIRNLSELRPTLLTGQPIVGKVRIASNDLIGTGETILRVVFH